MAYYATVSRPTTHLMTTEKLASLLDSDARPVVIDASIPMPGETRDCKAEFKEKHIPGAKFLDLKECCEKNTSNAYMLPTPDRFQECIDVFGFHEVFVLDGGLKKWVAEGRPIESGDVTSKVLSDFKPVYNGNLVKSLDQIKTNITDKNFLLVDARSEGRFKGVSPEPRKDIKPGHIPDSKCMFWTKFLEGGHFKSPEQLAQVYKEAGVDPMAPHVATCGSGVTACFIALSSYMLGNLDVPVYDGAWFDWYQHAPDDLKVDVPSE
ncbi:mpst [Bugula neritina]|uniref:Mpst n=1 Tax=Bugula neritina TaxID=10212 RepID=A0A7J7KAQ8_BUGNE|nr:mpst [Bugula neritina]